MFEQFCDVHLRWRDFDFAFEKLRGLAEILHRDDLQSRDHRRFRRIFHRHQQAGFAVGLRAQGNRQNAFARTHRTGEGEFADDDEMIELVGLDLFTGGEHADGNGKVETRPFLFHIGGGEVEGALAHRKYITGIGERGRDAVARFLHGGIGQTDDDDERVAIADVDLDFYRIRLNTADGSGTNPREHGTLWPRPRATATHFQRTMLLGSVQAVQKAARFAGGAIENNQFSSVLGRLARALHYGTKNKICLLTKLQVRRRRLMLRSAMADGRSAPFPHLKKLT